MATRFYLPGTGSAPVPPTPGSGWENTDSFAAYKLSRTKTGTGIGNGSARTRGSTTSGAIDRLDRVYVSDPIAAQTISGTFSMVIRGLTSTTGHNAWLQVMIRVVSNNGSIIRGTLYAGSTATGPSAVAGTENQKFGTTLDPRIKNAISLSSVAAQEGDRIQVEIGYRSTSTTSTYSATLEYGDPTSGSDMTLSASSSAGVPWIEFSANIAEPASGPPAFSGALALTGSGGLTLGVNALSVTGSAPLALSGASLLSLSGARPAVNGSLALSGASLLALSGKPGWAGSLALSGSGGLVLSDARFGFRGPDLHLGGSGALGLAVQRVTVDQATKALTGSSSLALRPDRIVIPDAGTVALVGSSTLGLAFKPGFSGVLDLSGSGDLDRITVEVRFEGRLDLVGEGSLRLVDPNVTPIKVWNGESWVNAKLFVFNGRAWLPLRSDRIHIL